MTPRDATDRLRPPVLWPEPGRIAVLVRHNFALLFGEPGPLISRLVQPLVLMTLMRPLYLAALAREGVQAGTVQVVAGMLVLFSLLALSVVGGSIMAERSWRTWDRLRSTPARAGELLLGKAIPAFAMLAAQQAPRAVDPSPEQKKPAADATTRSDDRETILDDFEVRVVETGIDEAALPFRRRFPAAGRVVEVIASLLGGAEHEG